jgi:hypothetical protein
MAKIKRMRVSKIIRHYTEDQLEDLYTPEQLATELGLIDVLPYLRKMEQEEGLEDGWIIGDVLCCIKRPGYWNDEEKKAVYDRICQAYKLAGIEEPHVRHVNPRLLNIETADKC